MFPRPLLALLAASASLCAALASESRTVRLPFLNVTGYAHSVSGDVDLPNPILSWFSIPYAAPPTGDLRFAYPQPPVTTSIPLNLTDYGPLCLQQQGKYELSEDCLTLSIFAPVGTAADAKLPVVFWIPGGSFQSGGGRASFNMPSMIANAPAPFLGVSINYRLGAFQSLSSTLAHKANALNLGFADQRAAMLFVRRHIALFGGDPDQVTLFGESAGAHSVGYHLLHVDPGAPRLAFPNWTYSIYETQTQEFLSDVGCDGNLGGPQATYKCLRSLDASVIQNASVSIYNYYNYSLRWPFQPVVDYKYVARAAHKSWEQGAFQKVDILTGFNSDEGSIFAPKNLTTTSDFRSWWSTLVPTLTSDLLDEIEELYPDPATPGSPYAANSTMSPQYHRIVDAYGDYAYISQVQTTVIEASAWEGSGGSVYKYHFAQTLANSSYVTHGSELAFIAVAGLTGDAHTLGKIMNAYYTSFIVTGNPNTLQPADANATAWPAYRTGAQFQLRFQGTNATVEEDDIRRKQTDFWRSIPAILQH